MALLITADALKILAMNNASCKVFDKKKILNLQYLTRCAKESRDFDFDKLVSGLPEVGHMYAGIKAFAKYLQSDVITQDIMLKFFGGTWHIKYVLEQSSDLHLSKRFGQEFTDRFLFAHMLVPVEITDSGDRISAIYKNGDLRVEIKNLIRHPFVEAEPVIGQKALVHQATVIDIDFSEEIGKELLREQISNAELVAAVRNIKSIDYKEFWDLLCWTEDIIKKL